MGVTTFSTDPQRAESKVDVVIVYLVTLAYSDGDFDAKAKAS